MRGTPDQDGLVLPAVSVEGSVVGVKSVILQTVKSGNTEKTRVVTRSSPRSVSFSVTPIDRSENTDISFYFCILLYVYLFVAVDDSL